MLIAGFPAGAWGTNCYLVAPAAGEECVIIDPGHQAAQGVEEALKKGEGFVSKRAEVYAKVRM